jgi:flavodoxin
MRLNGEAAMSAQCRILVVYYSRSGTTQRIAELLASEFGADVEAIREPGELAARAGARGYVRSLIDVLCHRQVKVMPRLHDLSAYDAVVVGSPVWASHASAPALAWLKQHGAAIRHLALFCSLGGSGSESALEQMAKAAGKSPLATCAITARDLQRHIDGTKRQGFGQKIRHRLAKLHEAEWMA